MMRLSVAQRSECGGRNRNEDSLGFCADETLGCFVLADGAGGHGGGDVASRTVVNQVLASFSAAPEVSPGAIAATIPTARQALIRKRAKHPLLVAMDSTMVALMLDTQQELAFWSHLGDSRIYLFRNGRVRKLTNDHSILQSMIDGGLSCEAIRGNKERNVLYAAVGSGEVPPRAVCEKPLALQAGDIFLLCTDGFWESVNEEVMEEVLQEAKTPEQWLNGMVGRVLDPSAEEQDNFSALAVWVGKPEETTRIPARHPPEHEAAD